MVSSIIVILLILGLLIGLKRGFIMQVLHLTGFIISFIIAVLFYKSLSPILMIWIPYPEIGTEGLGAIFGTLPLETAFYNGISFVFIFFVSKIILQIIANMLDFLAELPILHSVNRLLGAILGFLETYFILFILLYILALVPIDTIQEHMNNSSVAQFMVEKTPLLSEQIKELWFKDIKNAW
jgi:uncharacterized membrane protein required for colicin V production